MLKKLSFIALCYIMLITPTFASVEWHLTYDPGVCVFEQKVLVTCDVHTIHITDNDTGAIVTTWDEEVFHVATSDMIIATINKLQNK